MLATAITASWIARRVRSEQAEDLRRVKRTLDEAAFPLTGPVLLQMKGLSGAEFVLIGPAAAAGRKHAAGGEVLARGPCTYRPEAVARQPTEAGAGRATVSLGERNYLVDLVGVSSRSPAAAPSTLLILYPEDQLASRVRQAVYPALIAGLVAAGIAVAIATWLARRLARPIGRLVARTAAIAQGDFTPMPVARRNDELRDLAESINRMTEQLAGYERQVRHNERLKTLGQLGASMAHQLRNAATGGRMAIELHRRECPRGTADESLDVALRQLRLMESYLRQFLSIEESAPPVRQRVDTTLLVAEVLSLVRPSYVHAGIDLQFAPPPEPIFLCGDPEALRQLVTNLVLNAADAAVAGQSAPPHVRVEIGRSADARRLDPRAGLRSRPRPGGPRPVVRFLRHHQAGRFWAGAVRRPPDRPTARRAGPLATRRRHDVFLLRFSPGR